MSRITIKRAANAKTESGFAKLMVHPNPENFLGGNILLSFLLK
jgi:hypothetical protein